MDETRNPSSLPSGRSPALAAPEALVMPSPARSVSDSATSTASKVTWVSTFTLAPAVLGLLTAMFFLTGRAYWLGYLGYFNLESTMFSDDLSNQATRSVSAWIYAFQEVSRWIRSHFIGTVLIAFLLPVAVFLTLCLVAAVGRVGVGIGRRVLRWAGEKTRGARTHPMARRSILFIAHWFQPPSFARSFMRGFSFAYAGAYTLYLAFWVVSLVIVLLVGPFDAVGRSIAAKDLEEHFSKSAVVKLSDGNGKASDYRMILCAPHYCALFDGTKAVTVSAATITRTDSPAPISDGPR